MKILFIGDIVGKDGRNVVFNNLNKLVKDNNIDFVIANGENSAHGKGITKSIYDKLISAGINCITLGNHAFSKSMILDDLDTLVNLVRPSNLTPTNVGQDYKVYTVKQKKICVCNIMCNIFMDRVEFSPFQAMDNILKKVKADIYIVDLHGEATSEKIAFAFYYKDKINAVLGTHTHVQTADERIINKLGFISDVGMCGAYDSIIGRDIDEVIENLVHKNKTKYTVATGDAVLSAVVLDIDEETCNTTKIERIQIRPE